ncbi:class I SAM-dependent methyltransferase [Dethiobacter alkaliphilus]|uniref:Methyltransferase-related protein n=1 Tax=Dethiobacter alkaliphilus AHT 1 TaxID=555088 RepID=C0GID6_DETAL|nr:class I SAM-dependent methyltransferase [Dethiobacter alkaliphilus]EEG76984.1 methyltransferase-related protein [Dethiobacter alkaliphilus AHT 1]
MTNCLLCETKSIHQIEAAAPGYYHCRECDLIFLAPKFRLDAEQEKEHYETHNNTLDNPGYVQMFEKFISNAVLPYVYPNGRALDFGCGPGQVLQVLLERRGFRTDVYDPYYAPQEPQGPYRLVTSTEALEHVYEPGKVWQKLLLLLEAGGTLAVMTNFHQGPEAFVNWWYRRDPTHVTFFSEDTFAWLAKQQGLKILYSDGKKTITLKKQDE